MVDFIRYCVVLLVLDCVGVIGSADKKGGKAAGKKASPGKEERKSSGSRGNIYRIHIDNVVL